MMKKVLTYISLIYKWIIISFILQIAVLFYFNNVHFSDKPAKIKYTSIETTGTQKEKVDVKAKIPSEASDIEISCDGSYASYVLDGSLQIFDMNKKEVKGTISIPGGDKVTYYRWLPDRDMIIYGIKRINDGDNEVQVSTYDVELGTQRSYPKISGMSKESEVMNINLSPLTNVVYVKIKTDDTQAVIYKYDIMDSLSYVMETSIKSVILETAYEDKLLFQEDKSKVTIRNGNGNRSYLPFTGRWALIGIDSEDKVYIGELGNDNMVHKVRYGKLSSGSKEWAEIDLKNPILPDNAVITPNGSICGILREENAVCNLKDNTKTSFKGKYIDIINGYIVSVEDGELKLTDFK